MKKDIAKQEKSPKKSKIFTSTLDDSQDAGSVYHSKIASPKTSGRYVAELAWHKERS